MIKTTKTKTYNTETATPVKKSPSESLATLRAMK